MEGFFFGILRYVFVVVFFIYRPTLGPKVAVILGDLRRFKATLGKFGKTVVRLKAISGDFRRLKEKKVT